MATLYPWFKAIHVFFVVSWFAGLFYLPRIFVNLAQVEDTSSAEYLRLLGMSVRLKRFMLPLMIGTWVFGLAIVFWGPFPWEYWKTQGWFHAKLALVVLLTGYDGYCSSLLKAFKRGSNTRSHVWFRWFNEAPAVVLIAVVILVIVRPF
ncbi:CopD family protein [Uliginosibacterium sp. sgz301328]|uniref:CopD family protein n=1 Tax=Uliginosibacterium sp. sgz301328 TaxID=3243764 RepID=UPI00359E3DDB